MTSSTFAERIDRHRSSVRFVCTSIFLHCTHVIGIREFGIVFETIFGRAFWLRDCKFIFGFRRRNTYVLLWDVCILQSVRFITDLRLHLCGMHRMTYKNNCFWRKKANADLRVYQCSIAFFCNELFLMSVFFLTNFVFL